MGMFEDILGGGWDGEGKFLNFFVTWCKRCVSPIEERGKNR
jgi:hypothetical protein